MALSCFIYLCIYTLLELFYFRLAEKFNITDHPNHRSSHKYNTIRGGGIIFPLAFLIPLVNTQFTGWPLISLGLLLISMISFLDDIRNLNSRLRLLVQSVAVVLLLMSGESNLAPFITLVLFIVVTGVINAYNFMDGINGITSLYSIIIMGTLFWVNNHIANILPDVFYVSLLIALIVFSFFNVRVRARSFAGDVGSVSIAFIVCFLLIRLSVSTKNVSWILFLGIYGIDTVFTGFSRLLRKENIFEAHRSHFYQFLVNDLKIGHITVSLVYAILQLALNCSVIAGFRMNNPWIGVAGLFVFLLIYLTFRLWLEGRYRLFTRY
jgi:UDP-N-acetylmuramyl pentapeptide phosphotransferase/UDP-N-acetylglucosamine-1-phosphate transferase